MAIDSATLFAYQRGDYTGAIAKLEGRADEESRSLLAECYTLTSQPEKAESLFRLLTKEYPNRAKHHYNLGVFYSHHGRPNDAYLCYVAAWEQDNSYTKAGQTLVNMLCTAGYFNQAGQIAETLLSTAPNDPASYKSYGRVLTNLGRTDEAIANYRRGIENLVNGWKKLGPPLLLTLNFSTADQQTLFDASVAWGKEKR